MNISSEQRASNRVGVGDLISVSSEELAFIQHDISPHSRELTEMECHGLLTAHRSPLTAAC